MDKSDEVYKAIKDQAAKNEKMADKGIALIKQAEESHKKMLKENGITEEMEEKAKNFSKEDLPEKLKPVFELIEKEGIAEMSAKGQDAKGVRKGKPASGLKKVRRGLKI